MLQPDLLTGGDILNIIVAILRSELDQIAPRTDISSCSERAFNITSLKRHADSPSIARVKDRHLLLAVMLDLPATCVNKLLLFPGLAWVNLEIPCPVLRANGLGCATVDGKLSPLFAGFDDVSFQLVNIILLLPPCL